MTKGEQTRKRIIARAAPVFNVHGFAGTSMGQLTEASGLEKGGIYNHFPSKEVLALHAFDYAVSLTAARFAEALAGKHSAVERLLVIVGVLEHYVDRTMRYAGLFDLLMGMRQRRTQRRRDA